MASTSDPDLQSITDAQRDVARRVLTSFLDEILSPCLALLLSEPLEEKETTASMVLAWIEVNGYNAIASSLQDAIRAKPPETVKYPHKSRLEVRLQARDTRFDEHRTMVSKIHEASVALLGLLQAGSGGDTGSTAPDASAVEMIDGDVDGEPVRSPSVQIVSEPTTPKLPSGPAKPAAESMADAQEEPPPAKRRRQESLSDYSSPEPNAEPSKLPVIGKMADGPAPNLVNMNLVCKRNGKGDHGCTRPTCHFRHCSPAWRKEMGLAMVPTEVICPSERINLGMPTPCIDAFCKLSHRSIGFYHPDLDVARRDKVAYGAGNIEPTGLIGRKHPYQVWCKRGDDCKLAFCLFRHKKDGPILATSAL